MGPIKQTELETSLREGSSRGCLELWFSSRTIRAAHQATLSLNMQAGTMSQPGLDSLLAWVNKSADIHCAGLV